MKGAISLQPSIITFIPYADDRNLGAAYNECMRMLPEDGWACLLDHDVMWTTPEWHRQLSEAVRKYENGCFSGMTNRIKCPFQRVPEAGFKIHDVSFHRGIGAGLLENKNIEDVTDNERTPGGFMIMLSKKAWQKIGGFPNGLHYLDRTIWLLLRMVGYRIYIIKGLYLYHWHRAGGEDFQKGEWVEDHKLPDGRILRLKDREKLPVYGT